MLRKQYLGLKCLRGSGLELTCVETGRGGSWAACLTGVSAASADPWAVLGGDGPLALAHSGPRCLGLYTPAVNSYGRRPPWAGAELGRGSSLQAKQSLKGLTAEGCILTARPELGQVLS